MNLLETTKLVKSYDGRVVVDEVSFVLAQEEIVGLLGRNGAGKTTTFRMILGMVTPDSGAVAFDAADATHLLDQYGLTKQRNQRAETLSGGERRKLEIARALVTEPKLILLDEPFSGVDPIAVEDLQKEVVRLKKEFGKSILITDHNVAQTLKVCDRALIINDGQVFKEGTPKQIINDPGVRSAYLGNTFRGDEFDEPK